jgi:hypothetical protein
MEKFEFKIDLDTPYIKTIHFLGAAGVGFFIAAAIFTFKFERNVDWVYWLYSINGLTLCLFFAFFPGAAKKQSLTIDETGIYLHNYTFHWGQKKEITWEKIRGVGVQNNVIEIKNSVGSTEKINLPLHTKSQLEELRSYLKQMSEIKGLEYIK